MAISCIPIVAYLLCLSQHVQAERDTYNAVVVEFSPTTDSSIDGATNILNNVARYVDFIKTANDKWLADIIVFPEIGLRGYYNQEHLLEVPDPADKVTPCTHNTKYEAPLTQLSCAARATATYVVVNLGEGFFNSALQQTVAFNTDVVFDSNGTIIARYRKIHLFDENGKEPSPDNELVYFDTTFGVRFGIFTCFDIIFKDPGLDLARQYNINHFIFPTAWFSEMPFLTAIQEQSYWAYTLNATLLASGYNMPSVGSTGTGIYLGRHGPLIYNMTEETGSFMLYAQVPKNIPSSGDNSLRGRAPLSLNTIYEENHTNNMEKETTLGSSSSKLKLKKDFFSVYSTELITVPGNSSDIINKTEITIPFSLDKTICQNSLCCKFSLKIISVFGKTSPNIIRGDDYSQLHYRLAVFDGVRSYDHVATGGLQTCAILPCVNFDLASCGLRSDDPSAQPNMFVNLYQIDFVFESILITGNFSVNNSFIGPNALLEGKDNNYGSLLPPDSFIFSENNATSEKTFQTLKPVGDLVLASLYGRLFNRDGQPYTGSQLESSSSFDMYINIVLFVLAIIMIKFSE